MQIELNYDDANIKLSPRGEKPGLLARLAGASRKSPSFTALPESEQALIFALGDLRAVEDRWPGEVDISDDVVQMSHTVAASLSSSSAQALGLGPETK